MTLMIRLRLAALMALTLRFGRAYAGLVGSTMVLVGALPATAQTPCVSQRTIELQSRPAFIVGAVAGVDAELFSGVAGAAQLNGGERVVVSNARPPELRYFSRSGNHIRTVGRRGSGPGEFRTISAFAIGEHDSVIVADMLLKRHSVFAPDGTYSRSFRLNGSGIFPVQVHYAGQQRLAVVSGKSQLPTSDVGVVRDPLVVAIYDTNGNLKANVGTFPGKESSTQRTNRGVGYEHVAFARGLLTAAGGGLVFVADNARYLIEVYNLRGQKLRNIGTGTPGRPVSSEDQRRYSASRNGRGQTVFSPRHPAISQLLVSQTGKLWVLRYDVPWSTNDAVWDVFDNTGTLQCRVRMKPAARLLSASDNAATIVTRDSLDVEVISVIPFAVSRDTPN